MLTLIYGGSASGKSQFAEQYAARLWREGAPGGRLVYLAAMEPSGPEAQERIARHRLQRRKFGFETQERYRRVDQAAVGQDDTVLLECLSNLAANELFAQGWEASRETARERAAGTGRRVGQELRRLQGKCANLVVVTADVFCDGCSYGEETESYRRLLAGLARELALRADEVIEVVCGLPDYVRRSGARRRGAE